MVELQYQRMLSIRVLDGVRARSAAGLSFGKERHRRGYYRYPFYGKAVKYLVDIGCLAHEDDKLPSCIKMGSGALFQVIASSITSRVVAIEKQAEEKEETSRTL